MVLLFRVAAEKTWIFVQIRRWVLILTGTGKVVTSWPMSSVTTMEFIHVICRIFMAPLPGWWLLLLLSHLDVPNFTPYLLYTHDIQQPVFSVLASHTTMIVQYWTFLRHTYQQTDLHTHRNRILRMDLTTFIIHHPLWENQRPFIRPSWTICTRVVSVDTYRMCVVKTDCK
jgi:hypothetical protein